MKISQTVINKAKAKDACRSALNWLDEKPRTWAEMDAYRRDWMVWAFEHEVMPQSIVTKYMVISGGYGATVKGGDLSTVTGGDESTVTGGDESTVSGGDESTVSGGYWSTVTGGNGSTVTGGDGSTLTGGDGSVLIADYIENASGKWKKAVKVVDAESANKPHRVVDGKLVAVIND